MNPLSRNSGSAPVVFCDVGLSLLSSFCNHLAEEARVQLACKVGPLSAVFFCIDCCCLLTKNDMY